MKRLITLLFAMSSISLAAGVTNVETFESSALGRSWTYSVYLPESYESSGLEYPVLYLLHGSGGDETSWNEGVAVIDTLIEEGTVPPLIAVAPASDRSWWTDSIEPFETATIQDLIPEIDSKYRTIKAREGRGIAGFSMGGYGALRYALVYPDIFGAATVLSPALYDDQPPPDSSARSTGAFGDPYDAALWTQRNYPTTLESYAAGDHEVPIFIAVGDDDWNEPAGWRYNVEYQAVRLFERLNKDVGSPAELRVVDGEHDWELWGPMFAEGLRYMFDALRFPRNAN